MKNFILLIFLSALFSQCGFPSQKKMNALYQKQIDSLNAVREWQKGDDDKDGVINLYDSCTGTPTGARIDNKGCPMDVDNDGVIDLFDNCVTKAGPRENNGCPTEKESDIDKDGVPDIKDKCMTIYGLPENQGCPKKRGPHQ